MSAEKALVVMKSGEEHVLAANPYDAFWSKVTAIPGPYGNIAYAFVSAALEKVLRKRWADLNLAPDSEQRIPLKGLGDLTLERAAALHARFDGLETPHVCEADRPDGDTNIYSCG
jgi:hypothetical protein